MQISYDVTKNKRHKRSMSWYKIPIISCALALFSATAYSATETPAAPPVKTARAFSLYGELGGPGVIISANAELGVTPNTRLRFGMGAAPFGTAVFGALIWLPGAGPHRAELGLALSNIKTDDLFTNETTTATLPSISAGYRYQSFGGFMARGGVTIFAKDADAGAALLWPYLSLGYGF